MIKWGVVAGTHDASLSVTFNGKIVFASSSERFSRIKNDKHLNQDVINYALKWGYPDEIVWYENPLLKATRKIYAGQNNIFINPRSYMKKFGIDKKIFWGSHHKSHAAAGFYTSGFSDATIIVIDSIGEWITLSVWDNMKCIYNKKYPFSLGLFYSAVTSYIGLKPNEEEYILMAMAAFGNNYIREMEHLINTNLHRGINYIPGRKEDIAFTAQKIYETELEKLVKKFSGKENLVFSGGCALNCVANNILKKYFKNVWIMPNPGDSGSSLGAILDTQTNWPGPYLGYDSGDIYQNIDEISNYLKKNKICGINHGKAEFGPRALGNRSILADPRDKNIKDEVNKIKRRQQYRPFAPVILEHHFEDYFDGNPNPYMQFTSKCLDDEYSSITHVDGSSRVQTVNEKQNKTLFDLLTRFYDQTGCPMLLNTSLNIRGLPIANTSEDGKLFEEKYNIKVFRDET